MTKKLSLKQIFRKTFCITLCAVLLFAAMPFAGTASQEEEPQAVAAESGDLLLATIADTHYFPSVLAPHPLDANYEAFLNKLLSSHVNYETLDYIIDTAFESLASDVIGRGLKYVVVSGDLTLNGEKQGHQAFAEKLRDLEEDTGLQVFVINGNHDINNSRAASYSATQAEKTSPQDFMEIYYDLGYADAYHSFVDYSGTDLQTLPTTAGMLSYSVQLDDGYRLIMLDAGHYSGDVTEDGEDEQETSGGLTPELHDWLLAEIADAKNNGETPIMSTHWNMSGMNYMHEYILSGFVIDDHYILQEELADAGLHYVFSGHQHCSDIDITYSDSGEAMYSIITPTLTEFPAAYRITEFSYDKNKQEMSATFNTYEIDGTKTATLTPAFTGETPYSVSVYKNQYAQADPVSYLMRMIDNLLLPLVDDILAAGGIIPYVENAMELDLDRVFNDMLDGGIIIAGVELFTAENIINFLNGLDEQICSLLLQDMQKTRDEIIEPFVEKFLALQVSEVPCTKFINTLGFGSADKGGTLGDLLMSVLYYMYEGNEDSSDDAFMQDALQNMLDGEVTAPVLDLLRAEIIDGLLLDTLLANINVRISDLFVGSSANIAPVFDLVYAFITSLVNNGCFDELVNGDSITFESVMRALYNALLAFFNYSPNTSYLFLLEAILEIADLDFGNSVDAVIDTLLQEYVYADSMLDGIGYMLWKVVYGCVTDEDADNNVTYVYSGPIAIEPTSDEMQLPSHISGIFGTSSKTTYSLSWYTKYSVTGTDIELYEADSEPSFKGKRNIPTGVKVRYNTNEVTRSFNGVDLGIIGVMTVERDVVRHIITLEQLKADTTYYYRIGDASKGYWSETGTITTASGKADEFTFLHFTDTQSISPLQYDIWGQLARDAVGLYPDTAFIAHTGDFVDHGDGFMQWQWGLNTAADTLLHTPLMMASGNHEAMGSYAMDNYFYFADGATPAQFTDDGVYYSYDYNNAHFIVLNTNFTNDDGTLSDTQVKWLQQDVKDAADADWLILQLHKSVFSQGSHYADKDIDGLRKQLLKLMLELDIDIVLSGHDHVYMRTNFVDHYGLRPKTKQAIYKGSDGISYTANIDPEGSMFISGGTGSAKTYTPAPDGATAEYFPNSYYAYPIEDADNFTTPMFSAITINNNILTFAAYTYNEDGELYVCDSTAIVKNKIVYKAGDVNTNGKFEASDARTALRLSVGLDWDKTTHLETLAADFNGNGKIQADDARRILRCSVGLDLEFVETRSIFEAELDKR